jgi:hypothetical protein
MEAYYLVTTAVTISERTSTNQILQQLGSLWSTFAVEWLALKKSLTLQLAWFTYRTHMFMASLRRAFCGRRAERCQKIARRLFGLSKHVRFN